MTMKTNKQTNKQTNKNIMFSEDQWSVIETTISLFMWHKDPMHLFILCVWAPCTFKPTSCYTHVLWLLARNTRSTGSDIMSNWTEFTNNSWESLLIDFFFVNRDKVIKYQS